MKPYCPPSKSALRLVYDIWDSSDPRHNKLVAKRLRHQARREAKQAIVALLVGESLGHDTSNIKRSYE